MDPIWTHAHCIVSAPYSTSIAPSSPRCFGTRASTTRAATGANDARGQTIPITALPPLGRNAAPRVEAQIAAGVQALTIDATIRRVYYVKDKQHLTTLATEEDLRKGLASRKVADLEITFLASTSVPQSWIKTCRICGASFIARNRCQQGCRRVDHRGRYVCVLELERLQEG